MSRTYKDKPFKFVDETSNSNQQHNFLQAHSRGEAKVRKGLKRAVTKKRRREWLSNKETKGSWERINFQVWLY